MKMKKLLTVFKMYEKKFPFHGEDLLMNLSCHKFIDSGNKVTKADIYNVRRYVLSNNGEMTPTIYYHYL